MTESSRQRLARNVGLVAVTSFCASISGAAEPVWVKLQAERFGVISQLDEASTRRWAVEFDQFIDALLQLYAVNDERLPPLTMVLFENARDFAPYQIQTESGQVKVLGFFANMGTWSVIDLAGRRSSPETRNIVYHEGVHWFASAMETDARMLRSSSTRAIVGMGRLRFSRDRCPGTARRDGPSLGSNNTQKMWRRT